MKLQELLNAEDDGKSFTTSNKYYFRSISSSLTSPPNASVYQYWGMWSLETVDMSMSGARTAEYTDVTLDELPGLFKQLQIKLEYGKKSGIVRTRRG